MRAWRRLLPLLLGLGLVACGASPTVRPPAGAGVSSRVPPAAGRSSARPAPRLSATDLGAVLPQALQGEAAVVSGQGVYLVGGDGPRGFSSSILSWRPGQGQATVVGRLPQAMHDLAAAMLGGTLYTFGGGRSVGVSDIYAWRPGEAVAQRVGSLPEPLSDLAAVTLGGRVYVLGGWDGKRLNPEVYVYPGLSVVARLPQGLRYAAVTVADRRILVFGGRTADSRSATVYRVDPAAGSVVAAGALPQALAYGMAAQLGGRPLVFGSGSAIWDFGPPVTTVGQMPRAVRYGAAVTLGGKVYVFAGADAYAVSA